MTDTASRQPQEWESNSLMWPICTYKPEGQKSICSHTRTWPSERALRMAGAENPGLSWLQNGGHSTCRCHTLPGKVGPDTRFRCDQALVIEERILHERGRPVLRCFECGRVPEEILEYSPAMTGEELDAYQYVLRKEGTLNRENGHFACTACYIHIGMPSRPHGRWVAP